VTAYLVSDSVLQTTLSIICCYYCLHYQWKYIFHLGFFHCEHDN